MKKNNLIPYAIYFALGLVIVVIGIFSQRLPEAGSAVEAIGILSDCCLFPAVLFGGIGALTWIASKGTFDMLGYGFSAFFTGVFRPGKKMETFYEYKLRKEENGSAWLSHMFWVGMFYLAISIVCAAIYMMADNSI